MKSFIDIDFDLNQAEQQFQQFKNLICASQSLTESKDIMPFFKRNHHLTAMLGWFIGDIVRPDKIAFEYDLFGDFRCDIVVGDSSQSTFVFIELEDACDNSIFEKNGQKATRDWGKRFEHGYSQIIDWFWQLDCMKHTPKYKNMFNSDSIERYGMLIIGRESFFLNDESERLKWRKRHVVVDSTKIPCFTLDDVCDIIELKIGTYQSP